MRNSSLQLSRVSKLLAELTSNTRTQQSAPIVALYWLLNRLLTCWFISDVLPTLWVDMYLSASSFYTLMVQRRAHQGPSETDAPRVSENDDLVFEGG